MKRGRRLQANRTYHITHRCHNREFYLKFDIDREQYIRFLWEGRYKSTLIQDGSHFGRCMFYIDLNMVRAGVVKHPREWRWSGHHELIGIRKRYCVLKIENLIRKVSGFDYPHFLKWYTKTLDGILLEGTLRREAFWTESKCVGDEDFVNNMADKKERKKIFEVGKGIFSF